MLYCPAKISTVDETSISNRMNVNAEHPHDHIIASEIGET
jgi:hypothetical protein